MLACWHAGRSNILADEMGLGKTCQLLMTLQWLANNRNVQGPFLIVAPVSTLGHWQREVHTWTGLSCVVLHGPADARASILANETQHTDARGRRTGRLRFHILVTSPDGLQAELNGLSKISWQYLVVDEAHRLKNPRTKFAVALQDLSAPHCTLLTGTPVQNSVSELLGLMSFIDDNRFGDAKRDQLLELYGHVSRPEQVAELQELIRPYVLRRTKSELSHPLPIKRETLLKVSLTSPQMRIYRAIMDRSIEHIQNPRSSLRNIFMQLRKVCNHASLLEEGTRDDERRLESAHDAVDQLMRMARGVAAAEHLPQGKIHHESSEGTIDALQQTIEHGVKSMIAPSGKMVLLDKLLPKLKKRGHKVLLFSQFAMMLDLLEDYVCRPPLCCSPSLAPFPHRAVYPLPVVYTLVRHQSVESPRAAARRLRACRWLCKGRGPSTSHRSVPIRPSMFCISADNTSWWSGDQPHCCEYSHNL